MLHIGTGTCHLVTWASHLLSYAQKHPALRALCTRCSGDVLSSKEVNDSRLSYTFESRATGPRNHKWRWSLLTRFVERKHLRIRDVEISGPTRRVSYVLASIGHGSSGCIIECRSRKSVLALEEQHSIIHMCCNWQQVQDQQPYQQPLTTSWWLVSTHVVEGNLTATSATCDIREMLFGRYWRRRDATFWVESDLSLWFIMILAWIMSKDLHV